MPRATFLPAAPPPSPQPKKIYDGPAIPSVYDPTWQYFTNLTKDQIAWFQAQPEWQNFVSYVAAVGPEAMINANVSASTISAKLNIKKLNASTISK